MLLRRRGDRRCDREQQSRGKDRVHRAEPAVRARPRHGPVGPEQRLQSAELAVRRGTLSRGARGVATL